MRKRKDRREAPAPAEAQPEGLNLEEGASNPVSRRTRRRTEAPAAAAPLDAPSEPTRRRTRRRPNSASDLPAGVPASPAAPSRPASAQPKDDEAPRGAAPGAEAALAGAPAPARAEDEDEEEDLDSDLMCPLCHDLYCLPQNTPCGHSFCDLCSLRLFRTRLPGEPGVPPARRTRPCPLCRAPFTQADAAPAPTLDAAARDAHPGLYVKRRIQDAAAREALRQEEPDYFTLTVGNSCEVVEGGVATRSGRSLLSAWEFSLTLRDGNTGEEVDAARYIDQVVMHLSSGDAREVLTAPPFAVRRSGTGAERRMCYAVVFFKRATRLQPVAVTWLLNMTPGHHSLDVPLELARREGEGEEEAGSGGPGGASPGSRMGELYPALAGLLETFIQLDNEHRRAAEAARRLG